VRAFAGLREALGFSETEVTLPAGTDVAGLVARLAADYPAARLTARRYTAAVNRAYAPPDRVLADGDEVGLIPPVSGGSGDMGIGAGRPRPYEITSNPISLDDAAARVAAPELGGITLFAGTVRGVTASKGSGEGFTTDYLEYEAYPEMAEVSFAAIAAEAQARWPGISAVAVVHRVGRLEVGDTSIAIAVAAAHRGETFDACHFIIDRIKQIAPIWKREVGPDGSSWVEGPESAV
jgi:molybdopterin synthase catalytic subunit